MSRFGLGAAAAAVLAVYISRLDRSAGLFVDDAWYVVLATALWNGDGFRLISSAATPILPAFPPGFPLILAPVVGIAPDFPDSVPALKAVSIVAMLGVGATVYLYLVRYQSSPPGVAIVVALIATLMPAFVFLATSTVMAEPVFTLAQLCLALSLERAARAVDADAARWATLSGIVAGAVLLIRLAGVAGVAAGVVYLWHKRTWRPAILFAVVTAGCYAPWAIYSVVQRGTAAAHSTHGGSVSYGYRDLLLMRYGGGAASGRVTLGELPRRIATNITNIAGRDIGAFVLPSIYRGSAESGQEVFGMSGETGMRASSMGGTTAILWASSAVTGVVLIGCIAVMRRNLTVAEVVCTFTIATIALVPALTLRYVLPLAPFLVFYFLCGIEVIAATVRRRAWQFGAAFRVASMTILLLFTVEHARYAWSAAFGPTPVWLQDFAEVKAVTDWMNEHLTDEGFIVSNNPGLVYLATGRKGVSMGDARARAAEWRTLGVRYAVALHVAEPPPSSLNVEPLYESPRLKLWVMKLPARPDRK